MNSIVVYGYSDDLIEVEGDICEEYNLPSEDETTLYIAGIPVLEVKYDGEWHFTPIDHDGVDAFTLTPLYFADDESKGRYHQDTNYTIYSDVVQVEWWGEVRVETQRQYEKRLRGEVECPNCGHEFKP